MGNYYKWRVGTEKEGKSLGSKWEEGEDESS